jgi:hypothetical protein
MNYLVLDTRVFALSVLTDENGVHVIVCSLVALNGNARTNVGEQVEGAAEGKVEGDMALADYMIISVTNAVQDGELNKLGVAKGPNIQFSVLRYSIIQGKLTLESNGILADRSNSIIRDDRLAILKDRCNANLLPSDRNL